ncbi:hypothetical protein QOT17_022439 [Balamuthia mandrillaris]
MMMLLGGQTQAKKKAKKPAKKAPKKRVQRGRSLSPSFVGTKDLQYDFGVDNTVKRLGTLVAAWEAGNKNPKLWNEIDAGLEYLCQKGELTTDQHSAAFARLAAYSANRGLLYHFQLISAQRYLET